MSRTFRRLSGNQWFLEINSKNSNNPFYCRQSVFRKRVGKYKEVPIYGDYFKRTKLVPNGSEWVFSHLKELPSKEDVLSKITIDIDLSMKLMRDGIHTSKSYRKWYRRKFLRQSERMEISRLKKIQRFDYMDFIEEKEPRQWWD